MHEALRDAREFLGKVLPWPSEDQEGYINIHTLTAGRSGMGGQAFRDVDAAMRFINRLLHNGEQVNIYVCMSRQRIAQPATTKSGWQYLKARRNQENAVALKSLYLDLDVGESDGKFSSFEEMQGEFLRFLKETGLPRPSIGICSGNGGHVHWVFTREVTPIEYLVIAHALIEACKQHGLKVDGGVTTDTARVLRPVGYNYKDVHHPKPVKVWFPYGKEHEYADIEKLLEKYKTVVPSTVVASRSIFIDPTLFPPRPPILVPSAPQAGVETTMPQEEIRACLDAIPNTGGPNWELWNTTGMRIYAACDGQQYGLDEWQRWSDKNVVATTAGKDTCQDRWATFHHSPPTHTGAGALVNAARVSLGDASWFPKRTVQLTQQVTPQVTPQVTSPLGTCNTLPPPYLRDHQGRVYYVKQAKEEEDEDDIIFVSDYPMINGWLQGDPKKDEAAWLHFETTIRNTNVPIELELEHVGQIAMRGVLNKQGFMIMPGSAAADKLGRFMVSWVQHLQDNTIPMNSCSFGWNVENSIVDGFIYAGRKWTPAGDEPASSPDPVLHRAYSPTSDNIQLWKDAAKVITDQKRPELDVIIASSFAAPLVKCTGYPGVLISVYSLDSGVGKTTAMNIAQAVWGNPRRKNSLSDTANSLMNKMGALKSLPIYWDEVKTDEQIKRFVEITFNTAEGTEKARLNRRGKQIEPGDWNTLLVSATNSSLLNYVVLHTNTTTAGLYRILEYKIDRAPKNAIGRLVPSDAQCIVSELNDAYGAVGKDYASYLGGNYVELKKEVAEESRRIHTDVDAIEDERFWVLAIAVLIVGARIAKRREYVDFNEASLREFLYGVMKEMRETRDDQTVDMSQDINLSDRLQQFLNAARANHLLITERVNQGPGRPTTKVVIPVLNRDVSRLQGVWVQVGAKDKIMRISSSAFGEWCHNKGYSRIDLIRQMISKFHFRRIYGRIGAGTGIVEITGTTEQIYEVDLAATPFLDIIDGV